MSDSNPCSPNSLPPELILDDDTLARLMCVVIANVERKRKILASYRKLIELIEARRSGATTSGASSPEALARVLLKEILEKQGYNAGGQGQELPQFTKEELEEMEKTIQLLKSKSQSASESPKERLD